MTGTTVSNPTKFEKVIASKNIIPGDIIEMRGGIYKGEWLIQVGGLEGKPVIFQPYNGEKVTVEGSLTIKNGFVEFHNISITEPDKTKPVIYMTQPGTKIIGCDIANGFIGVEWYGSGSGSLINCTIHGSASYGIYTHNNNGGERTIDGCSFSNIGGYYSMHLYSQNNAIRDYTVSNVSVDKPVMVHGKEITHVAFDNNSFHARLMLGNGRTVEDTRHVIVKNNVFDGVDIGVKSVDCSELEITGNTFSIKEYNTSQANIVLQRNTNEKRTVIDGNYYTGGWFVVEDKYNILFKDWQSLGFDLNGEYTDRKV